MYDSLRKPSCKAPPGFERAEMLKDDYYAVRHFEEQTEETPAQLHLQIASDDAAFEQANDEDCWMEYSDSVSANKHVEMTREDVRGALERLRAIAPTLHVVSQNVVTAKNAPMFRYLVRRLVSFSRPLCPLTTRADNNQVMEPVLNEIGRFRDTLEGTQYFNNFDVAQADTAYELSITMVECAAPSQIEPTVISQRAIADARHQVAALGRLVQTR